MTQIMTPQAPAPEPPFADQAAVANALVELVRLFGHLPKPYINFPTSVLLIALQTRSPAAFEAWRTALQIAPEGVELKVFQGDAWLAAEGVFCGVTVELTGFGLALPAAAVTA